MLRQRHRARGLMTSGVVLINPYAGSAMALDFDSQSYWVGNTNYTAITAVPGYAGSRTNAVGFYDTDGGVDNFVANVLAINNRGYHAYGALTNFDIHSQAMGSRTLGQATVTSDAFVAPDGTTTGDLIVSTAGGSQSAVQVNPTLTGAVHTSSFFVHKTQGTATFAHIQVNPGLGAFGANINKTTGALSNNDATPVTAKYAIDLGTHWRFVIVYTATAGGGFYGNYIGPADSGTVRTSAAAGSSIGVWGAQTILGDHPDGGPIISTTTTAVTVGATALAVSLANATYSAVYTFDDNSTQTISTVIAAGVFNHPIVGTLNRPTVKLVTLT